jgi:predicted metal-dependent phosphoesterase TrpH
VRLDTHVHTFHSGDSTIYPLHRFMRECYNTPESVYGVAKARGMDLVVITDHDQISGALSLGDRPDVIVGSEVTGVFVDDQVKVHLNVFGLTERQHHEVQRLREDVRQLLPYLRQQKLYTSLNHVASGINGPIAAPHVAALLPWVQALEIINGSRLPVTNRTAKCLAEAAGKTGIAGSDAHTHRGIGRTWTEVPGAATREEFLQGLWEGRARVGGRMGNFFTMGSDVFRFAGCFYVEQARRIATQPLDWRGHAVMFGGVFGIPLVPAALVGAYLHFVYEERFNENLLFDLVAHPGRVLGQMPELAA